MSPVTNILANHRFPRKAANGSSGRRCRQAVGSVMLLLVCAAGCNPVSTGAKLGVRLVGDVIEDVDVKERAEALVGQPVSAADQVFGQPIDVFKDIHGDRRWRSYPVKLDVLGHQRYVIEVLAGKVVSISKAEMSGRKVDIPRAIILEEQLKGKSPQECEAKLELGAPLLTVRSENTKRLVQLYDAGMITDLGTPHYCIVRIDENDRCDDLEFVAVGASTKKDPTAS